MTNKKRSQAVLDLLSATNTRNTVSEGICDQSIMSKDFSKCFIFKNNDTKTFKVENSFIPFGDGATKIMRDFLAEYSIPYEDESITHRTKITEKLWTIVKGNFPDQEEQKAINDAVMLDELIFCAGKGYCEIQYACADYYEVQNWNLDCFYPIIVLVIAIALNSGQYIETMYQAAQKYLARNDEDQVRAVRLLGKWASEYRDRNSQMI